MARGQQRLEVSIDEHRAETKTLRQSVQDSSLFLSLALLVPASGISSANFSLKWNVMPHVGLLA